MGRGTGGEDNEGIRLMKVRRKRVRERLREKERERRTQEIRNMDGDTNE